jgi:dihydrolipoamide dehydrogenase
LELGSVYARLGSKNFCSRIYRWHHQYNGWCLGKELQKSLKKLGFEFYFNHKVTGVSAKGKDVTVTADNAKGKAVEIKGDYCLVAVGRRPYTDNLGLDKAGVKVDNRGKLKPMIIYKQMLQGFMQ